MQKQILESAIFFTIIKELADATILSNNNLLVLFWKTHFSW